MHPTLEEIQLATQITDDIMEQFHSLKKLPLHTQWKVRINNIVQNRILKYNRQLEEKGLLEDGTK